MRAGHQPILANPPIAPERARAGAHAARGGGVGVSLEPGDIILTCGSGLLSRLIRRLTRRVGESRTEVNHVGMVEGGPLEDAVAVEALITVKHHRLWQRYAPKERTSVAVYRPTNLTPDETDRVVAKAGSYVGRDYGVFLLVAHFLDWLLHVPVPPARRHRRLPDLLVGGGARLQGGRQGLRRRTRRGRSRRQLGLVTDTRQDIYRPVLSLAPFRRYPWQS